MKKITKIFGIFFISVSIFLLASCNITKGKNKKTENNILKENAYEIAKENGFEGTLDDWLKSLVTNEAYKSIYDLAKENGIFNGSLEEFIESLRGEKGEYGSSDVENGAAIACLSIVSVYSKFTTTITTKDWWGRTNTYQNEYNSGGSGVIIKDNKNSGIAYILTNYHVVYDQYSDLGVSNSINVYLYGMEYENCAIEATFIGGSMTYDVALIRIESDLYKNSGSVSAKIGNSSNLSIGEKVLAIGNANACGISVTSGIISVPSETIKIASSDNSAVLDMRVVRVDAAVNNGNSGGGLFDQNGKLIGIVNAKTIDESIEGMCYAIPINIAYTLSNKILNSFENGNNGEINKCDLGINFKITSSKAVYDKETKKTIITQLVAVSEIKESSPFYGLLKENDIILSAHYNSNEYSVNNLYLIDEIILGINVGDELELKIITNGEEKTVKATVDNSALIK